MATLEWSVRRTKVAPDLVARRLASKGVKEGTVVVGRDSRHSLMFSVVLRPQSRDRLDLLDMIITFSTSDGIRKDTGIITWLRRPNCVVAEGKIVATTSTMHGPEATPPWTVLSATIRTGKVHEDAGNQTSLLDLLGVDVDTDLLVEKVLESLDWMYKGWALAMHGRILRRFESMLEDQTGDIPL